MNHKLTEVNHEITSDEVDLILIKDEGANKHAYFEYGNKKYGLSYYVGPPHTLELEEHNGVFLGAGCTVCFINSDGVIKFLLPLVHPFNFFLLDNERVVIVDEIGVHILNRISFAINKISSLADIIVDGVIRDGVIILKGLEGEEFHL